MNTKEFLKRKPAQVGIAIFSLLLIIWCIRGFVEMTRQMDTREVAREFIAASDELQKSPPGTERAEVFLKRLKAIDPRYAPDEVKQPLHDYISAMEQGLDALKAGRDSKQYDAETADAKKRLIAAVKKWE